MKALTLTQPWATLVAIGAKRIETRSWSTRYRGPLAIHAAQGLGPVGGKKGLDKLCTSDPFFGALIDAGYRAGKPLPFGAIVAVCELATVWPVERVRNHAQTPIELMKLGGSGEIQSWQWTAQEQAFGDYSVGRYAWLLADVRALPEPIPAKGQLRLWDWEGVL
jgi:hypothetical protein